LMTEGQCDKITFPNKLGGYLYRYLRFTLFLVRLSARNIIFIHMYVVFHAHCFSCSCLLGMSYLYSCTLFLAQLLVCEDPGVTCMLFLVRLSARNIIIIHVYVVFHAHCFSCSCRFARTLCYVYVVSRAVVRAQGPGVMCMLFLVQLSVRKDSMLCV